MFGATVSLKDRHAKVVQILGLALRQISRTQLELQVPLCEGGTHGVRDNPLYLGKLGYSLYGVS